MRVQLSWLKNFVPLALKPAEIAEILTMAGLEVDSYQTIGENLQDIVVGYVREVIRHPNADKLSIATVSDGKETYQIVCGAPNCRAGLKVALARVGAILKGNKGPDFEIKKAKIRGVDSAGMLCSGAELGLSEDSDGILELPLDAIEGTSLVDLLEETLFDISLTPNLSHCASIMGIARELAALTGQTITMPLVEVKESNIPIEKNLTIEIRDQQACLRYACRLIENVKVSDSPEWLKKRLNLAGIRSINNIVDATNYVCLELGHPLHAFDYHKIAGQKIIVRQAEEGESLVTLDGKKRSLERQDLLICDQNKPLAIAGVMGGLESEVTESTQSVVIECAYFAPLCIRRTSKRLGLQTEASKRFERGTDPSQILYFLDRTAQLIQELAGGHIQLGVIDLQFQTFPEAIIPCRLSRLNQILGTHLSRGEVEDIFKRLHFPCRWDGKDQFILQIPTYRHDLQAEIDLIEEVARLYGYYNIPKQKSLYSFSSLVSAPLYEFEKKIRQRFLAEGLQEFLTCDLIGPSLLQIVQDHSPSEEMLIKVLNPTSIEQSILRTSLLPGLLKVVKDNRSYQNFNIAGFEVGLIHFKMGESYQEQAVVGLILTGRSMPPHWQGVAQDYDFFDLKGIIENVLKEMGIFGWHTKNLNLPTFHSGRQASLFIDSLEIGSMGEIHPTIQRRLDIPSTQRILFAEFNLKDLMQVAKFAQTFKNLPRYPSSERDWTVTIKKSISFSTILQLIDQHSTSLLEECSLKDIYQSKELGDEMHNITLHFVYRDLEQTMEQARVDQEHQRLTSAVLQEINQLSTTTTSYAKEKN